MAKKKAAKKTTKKAAKQAAPVVVPEDMTSDLAEYAEAYGTEDIDNEDIIIPKILIMQGMSKLVSDGKAKLGDMVDSLTGEILGNLENPIEFIPFKTFKTWLIFHDDEYAKTLPVTPENANWEIEEEVDGVHVRRDKVFNVYCMLPTQIETGEGLPYVLSFRRTSYYTGRKLTTAFAKLRRFKKPAFFKSHMLTANKQTKDKHTFFTFDLGVGRTSTMEEMQECKLWYDVVRGKVVDDSDLRKEEEKEVSYSEPEQEERFQV